MKVTNAAECRDARQKRKELADALKTSNKDEMNVDESRTWQDQLKEYQEIDEAIGAYESMAEREDALKEIEKRGTQPKKEALPATVREEPQGLRVFKNLGEQLRAVYDAAVNHKVDERLYRLNNEARALGSSEGVGSDGGFAVQTDFAGQMFESAVQTGEILSRVDTYDISAGSNSANWVVIDEEDVSESIMGGIQVQWAGEGEGAPASRPKTREIKLDLEKLLGFAYTTEELMQDTTFMTQLFTRGFTEAIIRKLEGDIISANGVKRPLGILQSGALVEVPKESGQGADTLVYKNIVKMWSRIMPRFRRQTAWLMHPDVEELLPFMEMPVGTGGIPVFLPPTGISQEGYSTLYGRPIISTDHCQALGDKGDIILADLGQYMLIRKGGVQIAQSIHVQFLTAEDCFRFMFRANGTPKPKKPLKIKNSANLRSAFVALETR